MSEGVQSGHVFYINGQYKNNSTYPQPAEVLVSDDISILERTKGYHVAVTRFSVDTQTTMFYIKKDVGKEVAVEILVNTHKDRARWDTYRSFSFTLSEDVPTLTSFLHFWNEHQHSEDPIYPTLAIDGAGRFFLHPTFSKAIETLGFVPGGKGDHLVRIQMSDSMCQLTGFTNMTTSVRFKVSNFRQAMEALDYVGEVVSENNSAVFLNPEWQDQLKLVAEHSVAKLDPVLYQAGGAHARITSKRGLLSTTRISNNRWAKLFWEERNAQNRYQSLSQYVWIHSASAIVHMLTIPPCMRRLAQLPQMAPRLHLDLWPSVGR